MAPRRPLRDRLGAPLDAAALAFFRFAIGALVAVSALRWFVFGWIDEWLVRPRFLFKYWGFAWVVPPGRVGLHLVFGALVVLGLLFAVGLWFRAVSIVLFLTFVYVQLLDVTFYLNHYYLVALLLGLMALMPLGEVYGLDGRRDPARARTTLPAWMTWLLRFQVACVYLYAGKAKLGADWLLHAQPLNIWLSARTQTPIIGPLLDARVTAYVFSWAGFLFDATVPIWLSWRRTRALAYVAVLVFHALTMLLFPIGMFPVIMVVAALIFFPPDWPRRFLRKGPPKNNSLVLASDASRLASPARLDESVRPPGRTALVGLGLYCAVQVLMPLRMHLYGGNVLWHEQGMRWAWKVMVREKNASITYVVEEVRTGRRTYVSPREYLDQRQERELAGQPDLILQLAHRIRDDRRARGEEVRVRVESPASLNGRAPAPLIDPAVDLSQIEDGIGKASWILPAPEGPPIHLRAL